jgi:hypothetical protein
MLEDAGRLSLRERTFAAVQRVLLQISLPVRAKVKIRLAQIPYHQAQNWRS